MRVPALKAGWLTQTFVHWPFPPDAIQAFLPPELVVDEYEGAAWVGFTPFLMADLRPPGVPAAVPGLPTFAETNLRTYVRRRDGRDGKAGGDGIWFLSIGVTCPLMLGARAIGAPYGMAALSVSTEAPAEDPAEGAAQGPAISYAGSRWAGGGSYRLLVRPGRPIVQTDRDKWLTGRWRAYTRRLGTVWVTPIEHEPWQLRDATVEAMEESVTAAVGLPAPTGEPLVHFSEGVRHVRLGPSRPCFPRPGAF